MATAMPTSAWPQVGERRFLIPLVDWDGYEALLKLVGDRRTIRVTYDRGTVELMSPLPVHERYGYLLGRMIQAITEELEIPMTCTRSMTFRRRSKDRGLEADDSYYIANVHLVPDEDRIDLEVVPPPDLAIEVEITNSILSRLDVYAGLGVPEIWRFDGVRLTVLILGREGVYAPSDTSLSLPFLPMDEIVRFLGEYIPGDDTRWARRFRAWVRDVLLPIYRNPAAPE
ncbi:Uma2 family endonuclease [Tundrisphaera lichenicola]|uniref:Uma2 family endonuclease n=1 Tax=Tundrisphaera lichenicola TaxID=2029860 RepID=UPI003EB71CEC